VAILNCVPAGPEDGDGVLTVCALADGAANTMMYAMQLKAATNRRGRRERWPLATWSPATVKSVRGRTASRQRVIAWVVFFGAGSPNDVRGGDIEHLLDLLTVRNQTCKGGILNQFGYLGEGFQDPRQLLECAPACKNP
jgi:hypothetical protein